MNHIVLKGCTPEPLASYLKSLSILRLVTDQKDQNARGWWENDGFHLQTVLDENGLVQFFLEDYSPTPIASPWNGGSGFFEGDNTVGLEAIRASSSSRLALYRETIDMIMGWPEMPPTGLPLRKMLEIIEKEAEQKSGKAREDLLGLVNETRSKLAPVTQRFSPDDPLDLTIGQIAEKAKLPKKPSQIEKAQADSVRDLLRAGKKINTKFKQIRRAAGKDEIIQAYRDRLSDQAVEWLDAAVVIGPDGELGWPPLLGSGGIEGHLDYSNTFMKRVSELLLTPDNEGHSQGLLRNALFGEPVDGLVVAKVGQYHPGRAGGYNQGAGIEKKEFPTNPWDFVLTMEGTMVWASNVARRHRAGSKGFLRSPFTVQPRAVGYSSSSENDEKDARAEVWAPLWKNPVGYGELKAFLSEGRADVGRKNAENGIEFAEAASSLGVDRGVSEFVRFSLLKRRGDSYVALPVGRFPVQARIGSDLLRELDAILQRLDRFLRKFKEAPASYISARRGIDHAIYELLLHGGAPYFKMLIAAIGKIERMLAQRDISKDPKLYTPLSGLSPRWLVAADDGSVEVRIAAALAAIGATGGVGPIRANLAPIDPEKPWTWGKGRGQMAWVGNSLSLRMASVLNRRMMDAERLNCKSNPVYSDLPLRAEDIASFIDGQVDEDLIEDLLFGFNWLRWSDRETMRSTRNILMQRWSSPVSENIIPRSWALLKLLFLPRPILMEGGTEVKVIPESSIIPLLNGGRIADATLVAQRRLFASGLSPVKSRFLEGEEGSRIAAALLLPLRSDKVLTRLVLRKPGKSNDQ